MGGPDARGSTFLRGVGLAPILIADDYPFTPAGVAIPPIPQAIDLVLARAAFTPTPADLQRAWTSHTRVRTLPVVLAVTHSDVVSLCAAPDGQRPACAVLARAAAESLCRNALATGEWQAVFVALRHHAEQAVVTVVDKPLDVARDKPFDVARDKPRGSFQPSPALVRRQALADWSRFLLAESHVIRRYPTLFFQEAANQPDVSAPAAAAAGRTGERRESRPWFRHHNKSRGRDVCVATLTGHAAAVNACAFSPDGRRLVSASADASLRVWDVAIGRVLAELDGHLGAVFCCAFSADGRLLISGSADETLRVWSAKGDSLQVLRGHGSSVRGCAVSPDGTRVLSASSDRTLRVWDIATWTTQRVLSGHTGAVTCCAFSPDNKWIVSGSTDGTVRRWNGDGQGEPVTLRTHDGPVAACAVSPDGRWVLSASGTSLKLSSLERDTRLTFRGPGDVRGCAFSPDSHWLAFAMAEPTVVVWDPRHDDRRFALRGHIGDVESCAFSPNGRLFSSAGSDATIRVWLVERIPLAAPPGASPAVNMCAISVDGRRAAAVSAETVRQWDLARDTGELTLSGHAGPINACALSPDGSTLVSASDDKTLTVWRAGVAQTSLKGHRGPVLSCAFSLDGRWLASGSSDHVVRTWDTQSWRQSAALDGHEGPVRVVLFEPSGNGVLSASDDGTLRIWWRDTADSAAVLSGHEGPVTAAEFSPDYRTIVSASDDGTARLWNARSGRCRAVLRGHRTPVRTCGFSPDGRWVLTAGTDGVVNVWDASSGVLRSAVEPSAAGPGVAVFAPDGLHLAFAEPGELCLWDLEHGVVAGRFITDGEVSAIRWSLAGLLAVGTKRSTVHLLRPENLGVPVVTAWSGPPSLGGRVGSWLGVARRELHVGCPHCRRWFTCASPTGHDVQCPQCREALRLSGEAIEADWQPIAAGWAD